MTTILCNIDVNHANRILPNNLKRGKWLLRCYMWFSFFINLFLQFTYELHSSLYFLNIITWIFWVQAKIIFNLISVLLNGNKKMCAWCLLVVFSCLTINSLTINLALHPNRTKGLLVIILVITLMFTFCFLKSNWLNSLRQAHWITLAGKIYYQGPRILLD